MKAPLWMGVIAMATVAGCTQMQSNLGTPMDQLTISKKQPHCTQYDVLLAARQALRADDGAKGTIIGRVLYEPNTASRSQAKGPTTPHWKVEVLAEQAGPKFVLVDDLTGDVIP